jgi:hypothetical protein
VQIIATLGDSATAHNVYLDWAVLRLTGDTASGGGGDCPDGDGGDTVSIYAYDTCNALMVEAVLIWAKNTATDVVSAYNTTDATGVAVMYLADGTYRFYGYKPGYNWTAQTITINGNHTDTIPGCPFTVDPPDTATHTARVYGYVVDNEAKPIVGADVCAIYGSGSNAVDTISNYIISPAAVCRPTDTSGYFYLDLIGTHWYTDTTRGFYNIKATFNGVDVFEVRKLWVPSSGTMNLTDTIAARR